jgi:hypothetical protein
VRACVVLFVVLASFSSPGRKPPSLPVAAARRYVGPTATITLLPDGSTRTEPGLHRPPAAEVSDPRWGSYRQRGAALGIPICAFDCVDQRAVEQAEHIVHSMLQDAEQGTVATMLQGGAEVAVIGRHQATTDLPMYRHLRGVDCENGGGDYDEATRGLGGNPGDWVEASWGSSMPANGGKQQASKRMAGASQGGARPAQHHTQARQLWPAGHLLKPLCLPPPCPCRSCWRPYCRQPHHQLRGGEPADGWG